MKSITFLSFSFSGLDGGMITVFDASLLIIQTVPRLCWYSRNMKKNLNSFEMIDSSSLNIYRCFIAVGFISSANFLSLQTQ